MKINMKIKRNKIVHKNEHMSICRNSIPFNISLKCVHMNLIIDSKQIALRANQTKVVALHIFNINHRVYNATNNTNEIYGFKL